MPNKPEAKPQDVELLKVKKGKSKKPAEKEIVFSEMPKKKILNAGCAGDVIQKNIGNTWKEVRCDIDEKCKPDFVCSITDLKFEDSSFDAVFCQDVLEHLYLHEVPIALKEFFRITKPGGFLYVQSPDLTQICKLAGEKGVFSFAYKSDAGDITPYDVIHGYQKRVAMGDIYMAHKSGFDCEYMKKLMFESGYRFIHGSLPAISFTAIGIKL